MLSDNDKNNVKIFKYLKNQIDSANNNIDETNITLENSIKRAEKLIRKTSGNINEFNNKYGNQYISSIYHKKEIVEESYSDILEKAETDIGKDTEYKFDDILSSEEIMKAYSRVDEINYKFSQKTRLKEF